MIDSGSNIENYNSVSLSRFPSWILALAGAAAYPGFLTAFSSVVKIHSNSDDPVIQTIFAVCAVVLMALATAIPGISLWALTKIRDSAQASAPALRRLLHLTFAVSPLYVFTLQVSAMIGLYQWHTTLWIAAAIIAITVFSRRTGEKPAHNKPTASITWMRVIHGVTALMLLLGFFLLHLSNHSVAIWSAGLHEEVMKIFRLWYRSDWVESVILGLIGIMLVTGVPMVTRHTRSGGDLFRNLQTTSGVYLSLFLCAHLIAVLSARMSNIETDWVFATGQNGLIKGAVFLIPYYILSVFMFITHVSLGFRMVLLAHNTSDRSANRIFYSLMGLGIMTTIVVSAALLGLHTN